MKIIRFHLIVLLFACVCARAQDSIVQSARELPVVDSADVVVVGGNSAAVAAAIAAQNAGASALIIAPRIGLGTDITDTRELFPEATPELLAHPIASALFPFDAPFSYSYDATPDNAHADPSHSVLKDGVKNNPTSNSVQFNGGAEITIAFGRTGSVERVEVYWYRRTGTGGFSSSVTGLVASVDGVAWSPVAFSAAESIHHDAGDDTMLTSLTPDAPFECAFLRVQTAVAGTHARQLLDEIRIVPSSGSELLVAGAAVTPFGVKKKLEADVSAAGARVLMATLVTDVVRDENGDVAGVVIANRSGRQVVAARAVIDCTENAVPSQKAGAVLGAFAPGDYEFSRIVISDATNPPSASAQGLAVSLASARAFGVSSVEPSDLRVAGAPVSIDGRAWRCVYTATLDTGSIEEILEVEQAVRDLTWTFTTIDAADRCRWLPPNRIAGRSPYAATVWEGADAAPLGAFQPAGVDFVWTLSARADITRELAAALENPGRAMAMGSRIGAEAAAVALSRPSHAGGSAGTGAGLEIAGNCSDPATDAARVSELLDGFQSKSALGVVTNGAEALPVVAQCDVLVVGAGTAGGPAAIGAARAGADTIVVDILYRMGGIVTDGRIGRYYHGNIRGFQKNELTPGWKAKGAVLYEAKSEWLRDTARGEGARVLYGTLANGAVVDAASNPARPAIKGAVVVFPDGSRGAILARTVIDSTGNSEIIQAAGAETFFLDHNELANQGTGWARQTLGNSYMNTDTGFVNDKDPTDLTFFSRRVMRSVGAAAWDMGQNPASRERHRIIGEHTISPLDILCNRSYPDTIVRAQSNFDSHGFTTHELFFFLEPPRSTKSAAVPFRALVPRGLDGALSTGLGISAHRDAMPIVRMQPDVENQGYAAGLAAAAARAADENCAVRDINIAALQTKLVAAGNITSADAQAADNFPPAPSAIANAVAQLSADNNFDTLPYVLADADAAIPLLRGALATANANSDSGKADACAIILALLGDADAPALVADLIAAYPALDTGWNFKGMDQYGFSVSPLDARLIAASRSGAPATLPQILAKSELLVNTSHFSHYRASALALERYRGDPAAIARLTAQLALCAGNALAPDAAPPVITSYANTAADAERNAVLKEIATARALYKIGDNAQGDGEATLAAYANDPRGVYAAYARMVLAEGNEPDEDDGDDDDDDDDDPPPANPLNIIHAQTDIAKSELSGANLKTGAAALILDLPHNPQAPVVSGKLEVAEGSLVINGAPLSIPAQVPCGSFETTPPLSYVSPPTTAMDRRGSAATGCVGWVFKPDSGTTAAMSGYQRNGSYFSSNTATHAPDGIQTAFVRAAGYFECSFTAPQDGEYILRFKYISRYYYDNSTKIDWWHGETITPAIDGVAKDPTLINNTVWAEREIALGPLQAGAHTLRFQGAGGENMWGLIDDVRIATVPEPLPVNAAVARDFILKLADGTTTELNFPDTIIISSLTLDGVRYDSGIFNAATHPEYFTGIGTIIVRPAPTLIIFK